MNSEFSVSTRAREEFVDLTPRIKNIVSSSKTDEAVCFIYCPHTTCGLTINENADPSVKKDIINTLRKIVPDNLSYSHLEGNSPAHIKSSLVGHSLTVFVQNGSLKLGTWQGIFLCEFDGPRTRSVFVKVVSAKE